MPHCGMYSASRVRVTQDASTYSWFSTGMGARALGEERTYGRSDSMLKPPLHFLAGDMVVRKAAGGGMPEPTSLIVSSCRFMMQKAICRDEKIRFAKRNYNCLMTPTWRSPAWRATCECVLSLALHRLTAYGAIRFQEKS